MVAMPGSGCIWLSLLSIVIVDTKLLMQKLSFLCVSNLVIDILRISIESRGAYLFESCLGADGCVLCRQAVSLVA